jgi:hypothetical protein
MELSPASAAQFGYSPQLERSDDCIPQMRPLSTNGCPNSSTTWLTDPPGACPPGLTSWGYCGQCFEDGLVPEAWRLRVEEKIAEAIA